MAKPFTEWTVLPHGKLERLQDNLLSVTGLIISHGNIITKDPGAVLGRIAEELRA